MDNTNLNAPILPGACIGILGGGQLGRMLALAARQMGYRVGVFSSIANSPAAAIADIVTVAAYDDLTAIQSFAKQTAVITYEFENVPANAARAAAQFVPIRPGILPLEIAQNRLREKDFLSQNGFPVALFAPVRTAAELQTAIEQIGLPAVLKTADSGYDGKGQRILRNPVETAAAFAALGNMECVLEAFVPFDREVSVVAARGVHSEFAHYGVIENHHTNHILDVSIAPAPISDELKDTAVSLARGVLEALDVIGVLCVEFFLVRAATDTGSGSLIINELAPRPHNSGHLTIEACPTSQFEQQLRAVCGLPLGATTYQQPAAMANLLGDLWASGEPKWENALALPDIHLHLYGKSEARAGRKMGHLTALADTPAQAETMVRAARARLTGKPDTSSTTTRAVDKW